MASFHSLVVNNCSYQDQTFIYKAGLKNKLVVPEPYPLPNDSDPVGVAWGTFGIGSYTALFLLFTTPRI